jgi:hypothetical protein
MVPAVDPQGNLWVTDARIENGKGYQVFKFSSDGRILMTLGKAGVAGAEPGLFDEAHGRGDRQQRRHLHYRRPTPAARPATNRIAKFSKEGKFIKMWGRKGSGPNELDSPHTIAVDSRGRVVRW